MIGKRIQYRWRNSSGWLSGVITGRTKGKAKGKRKYTIHCADDGVISAIQLNLSEHGASRRWVLWQWANPPDVRGQPAYIADVPIATAPAGWSWKVVKERPANANVDYLKALGGALAGRALCGRVAGR